MKWPVSEHSDPDDLRRPVTALRMKMKVALGPMEMMTDSLRLSEGVPEQMKKGEVTLVLLVTEKDDDRCLTH